MKKISKRDLTCGLPDDGISQLKRRTFPSTKLSNPARRHADGLRKISPLDLSGNQIPGKGRVVAHERFFSSTIKIDQERFQYRYRASKLVLG